MAISISFIAGCMFGVEMIRDEEGYVLVADLFFVRFLFEF